MRKRPWVLGLVGGIGSGKSTVASVFANLGAEILDADRLVHQLLDHPALKGRLVAEWGPAVLCDGRIDRTALARVAFRDEESVRRLNEIVHPRIQREVRDRISRSRKRIVVLDAPLLLEAGADATCDRIAFVDAPRAVRLRRVRNRGWGPGELRRRERFQWTLSRKRRRADYVIDNSGSRAAAARQVRAVLRDLGIPSHHR